MKLRDWRIRENLNLREMADSLGIGHGANPSRRMQRIETGEAQPDAILADDIVTLTKGEVTLKDMNDTRKEFLSAGRSMAGVAQ